MPPKRAGPSHRARASVQRLRGEHQPTRRSKRISAFTLDEPKPNTIQNSPLLNVPPELRNRIYNYLWSEDGIVWVPRKGPYEPAILKTCRQIRNEATAVYYGNPLFIGKCDLAFKRWTEEIGEEKRRLLRNAWVDKAAGEPGAMMRWSPSRGLMVGRVSRLRFFRKKESEDIFDCLSEVGWTVVKENTGANKVSLVEHRREMG